MNPAGQPVRTLYGVGSQHASLRCKATSSGNSPRFECARAEGPRWPLAPRRHQQRAHHGLGEPGLRPQSRVFNRFGCTSQLQAPMPRAEPFMVWAVAAAITKLGSLELRNPFDQHAGLMVEAAGPRARDDGLRRVMRNRCSMSIGRSSGTSGGAETCARRPEYSSIIRHALPGL